MKPDQFKKGDVVYQPHAQWTAQPKPCPVCNATTRILVKAIGAEDKTGEEMDCEYCKWALRDGLKLGHVVEDWDWEAHVTRIHVDGVEVTERPDRPKEIKYIFNYTGGSWNSVNHDNVYATEAEARVVAEEMKRVARGGPTPGEKPNPSHKVGYARGQIKKAREEMQRWENYLRRPAN